MDSPSSKRLKHDNEHASSKGTSQSSVFSHNSRVRLEFLEQFDELKCRTRSVNTDLEEINTKRRHLIGILEKLEQVPIRLPYASTMLKPSYASSHNLGQSGKNYSSDNIIDLDPDEGNAGTWTHSDVGKIGGDATVVVDSGNKDAVKSFGDENSSSEQNAQCLLPEPPAKHQDVIILDNCNSSTEPQVLAKQGKSNMDIDNASHEDHHEVKEKIVRAMEKDVVDSYEISCEVIPNEPQINENNYHYKDNSVDELEDLWKDMSVALACSKSIVTFEKNSCEEMEVACNHDFLMKDDLGIVCRVCGLIQQRIENIFEYSWKKRKESYRTRPSEHRNSSDPDATGNPLGSILKVVPDALLIHPQHSHQMKPHQVEGFNFLVKNLADESNPGGCILAHAPGSGKTFLLISFIHSFLARYRAGRPLIMLPKSVLRNWKKEFLCWQVEDIPLYDFYSSKANNRSEQLKVLKLWEENRSILLLGYQQFTHIISDDSSESEARMCKEKLLKGTLFQNRVNEVFTILNLVRPNFLNMQKSHAIKKRILTKVDMFGKSARSRNISDKVFYDLIEENFEKDSNDKTRVMIIQNLRELTENVLHYYQGENLKELPGLVDFTVLLNAIGCAFRPGQSKVVFCYRLVAAGSLEEQHHHTAFKKERVSKLWFEWNELSCNEDFELAEVDVSETGDRFFESPALREDIKSHMEKVNARF
ncbi:hypothetical protein PR202_ga26953 [Eleusine coracana subsp. coracana]|uniref:Helicase ATP-binding domain-containing protein n=1 Tax=Eleusine coracana subsp. coracana TaxID=191504 RepID=A0AAV5DF53_ELECO|nr:hypothetical protein PR202_ga26953 [Eleusine coracana subsp. coracana]